MIKAFVIHLKSAPERLKNLENRIPREHFDWEIFDAIACPGNGARGCFTSHLEIIKEAKRRNLDKVAIFEDDVDVKNFQPLERMPAPIIVMSINCGDIANWTPFQEYMKVNQFFASTAGILISFDAYDELIAYGEEILNTMKVPEVDIDLYSAMTSKFDVLVPVPFWTSVIPTTSTICSQKTPENDAETTEIYNQILALKWLEMTLNT